MSGGGNSGIVGGGSGGTTSSNGGFFIDITGEADLSFHGIPLNAIKKAKFTNKLAVVKNLLKIVVNGCTYDFQKTALNGAVIFRSNYGMWDFIAPDNRFNFSNYAGLTIGDTLLNMEQILTASPIPAWDVFIEWLGTTANIEQIDTTGFSSCWVAPLSVFNDNQEVEDVTKIAKKGNIIDLTDLTDCVSFIQSIEYAIEPMKETALSDFMTSETAFGFVVFLCTLNEQTGAEEVSIPLSFRFRQ